MIKTISTTRLVSVVFVGVVLMGGAATVHAQTAASAPAPDTVTTDCTPSQAQFAALLAIQNNPNLTPSQELNQELTLRRELLAQTISCATSDAQNLQAALAAVSSTTQTVQWQSIQSQLAGDITDAINFYGIESAKVNGAGLSGTEAIAKEVLSWRATNYAPLGGDVNNFALWSQNQALFDTAENRLTQTARVVAFIDSATTGGGALDTALAAAQTSLTAAQSENVAAGVAIAQAQPPDQTLGLIQQSLQSLADTYKKFSDVDGLLQTLLPTSN